VKCGVEIPTALFLVDYHRYPPEDEKLLDRRAQCFSSTFRSVREINHLRSHTISWKSCMPLTTEVGMIDKPGINVASSAGIPETRDPLRCSRRDSLGQRRSFGDH